jgi:hypothetical protein
MHAWMHACKEGRLEGRKVGRQSNPLSNKGGGVGGWDFVDHKHGSNQTVHSPQNPSLQPHFFSALFLVVPSFWLYKI